LLLIAQPLIAKTSVKHNIAADNFDALRFIIPFSLCNFARTFDADAT